jgi:protein-S-isoprenylcysteine O-methyltransferase Ste14
MQNGAGLMLLLKNILFTVIVPGTVAVYLPLGIAKSAGASADAVLLALPVLLLGAVIYAWCVWDFATFGRGTPAPIDAPKKLVVRGLYKWTRNPIYIGVLTAILGWSLLFQCLNIAWYGVVVGVFFHLFVVFYEEPTLADLFGADYTAYCSRVGRWLPWKRRPPDA